MADSCRTCKFSNLFIEEIKHKGSREYASVHGLCLKKPGNRYPIYIPDAKCKDWRKPDEKTPE